MTGTAWRDLKQAVIARDARVCQGGLLWLGKQAFREQKRSVEDPFFMV